MAGDMAQGVGIVERLRRVLGLTRVGGDRFRFLTRLTGVVAIFNSFIIMERERLWSRSMGLA